MRVRVYMFMRPHACACLMRFCFPLLTRMFFYVLAERLGRVHMEKQDLSKMAVRRFKAHKRTAEELAADKAEKVAAKKQKQ